MSTVIEGPAIAPDNPPAEAIKAKGSRAVSYWLYLAPMLVGTLIVVLVPFGYNVYLSFFHWKGGLAPMRFSGLDNYKNLMVDEQFWSGFVNSLFMIVGIVIIPTILGLILASSLFDYISKQFNDTVASVLRALLYLPQIVPIAVAGIIWSWVLATQNGVLNSVLEGFGISSLPDWLGNPNIAIYAVVLMVMWLQLGYPVVIFMSALERVDPALYEAAALDGAGWWRRFFSITIPQIRPEIFVVVLTATISALKVFAPVLILTMGGPEGSTVVPSFYAYRNFFELSKVGYGSTISTVMSVLIIVIAWAMLWFQRRNLTEEA
ncbi:carbohydrate ABC transporter permease [Acidipropionibacterium virtanenii]|uniref:Lactose transport system permease protein LacF n=1 Tax=Acidipropionibacterium virtanenii TaxID=2057246 RepID=A0A344UQJ5_9ACTN|nr:sugar ABC transporter permease [Acidipropionibacterium virtanenii]AXE37543.1 Lactose transport system permease protein LacF [Acidipropionibacterium virtanenii]